MNSPRPFKIGITGGIGSGKSTVCRVFELLGVPIYYADIRGKYLMRYNSLLVKDIKQHFGKESYQSDGSLNREYLAENVFSSPERLALLNSLVHPAVAEDFKTWCQHHLEHSFVIKEAALIFETGGHEQLDATLVIMAAKEVRIQRVFMRDKVRTLSQIEDIISHQVSDELRKEKGDYFIQNSGEQLLLPQIMLIYKKLIERFEKTT